MTGMSPRAAIENVLRRHPYGVTTRSITAALMKDEYRWPTRNSDQYPWASAERVGSTLRAMQRDGLVVRADGPNGYLWRLADARERGATHLDRMAA